MPFCRNCGSYIAEDAKFCIKCGSSVGGENSPEKRSIVNIGKIYKCPNCGEVIDTFTAQCPSCGYEFRDSSSVFSIKGFTSALLAEDSKEKKVALIRNFPIPNTKEDIVEFMLLASTNIIGEQDKQIFDAWIVKLDQSFQKAKLVIKNKEDLQNIQEIYEQTQRKIKIEKRIRGTKTAGQAITKSGSFISTLISIILKNVPVAGGIVLYVMAINTYNNHGNGSMLELIGAILLIVSASLLYKRSASLIEYLIGAGSGALSVYMSRFLDNGSLLLLAGWLVVIIVVVNFFIYAAHGFKKRE